MTHDARMLLRTTAELTDRHKHYVFRAEWAAAEDAMRLSCARLWPGVRVTAQHFLAAWALDVPALVVDAVQSVMAGADRELIELGLLPVELGAD